MSSAKIGDYFIVFDFFFHKKLVILSLVSQNTEKSLFEYEIRV